MASMISKLPSGKNKSHFRLLSNIPEKSVEISDDKIPNKLRKNHFSYGDLCNIPKEKIAPEPFLKPDNEKENNNSKTRIKRSLSYPSDNSQFNIYHSRSHLDDHVLHLSY
jgi:hypothetical protein